MPNFECFSVFFCVYIRKCLIFSEKKSCIFIKNNLENCCTIQNNIVSLQRKRKTNTNN